MVNNAIEIRQRNEERIREAIQRHETCTKADIAKETDLSMATCSTALNEMLERNEILKVDQVGNGIGRPSDLFSYNKDHLHVLSICVYAQAGNNTIDCAVADALGCIMDQKHSSPETLSAASIEALVAASIEADPLIQIVGIGIPGVVEDNIIEFCDIPSLEKVDFVKSIGEKFGVNVVVRNDMNTITYYLYHKQPHCSGDFAAIYFPDTHAGYVGSGFIVNGHSLHGANMLAGEVYHVAEAFGITPADQQRALQDRAAFRKFASQILLTICCTINPSNVVITGNAINEDDLADIKMQCTRIISERHLPEIKTTANIFDNYAAGLIRLTLDSVLFPFIV